MADEKQSASEKKKEDWMNSKWRPMMGWMYMVVCFMDMVIFPIAWSLLQTLQHVQITQWNPLTLQGAGLFHIAMGAVLGIAAYGRTQEKLGGANNGGIQLPSNVGTTYTPPGPIQPTNPSGFGVSTGNSTSGFGGQAPTGGSAPSAFSSSGGGFGGASATATPGFGGGFGSTQPVATTASGKKIVPGGDQPLL